MSLIFPKIKNYIDGAFCDPVQSEYLDNINPTTGEIYSSLPDSKEMDVARAVSAARKAFTDWSGLDISERCQMLHKIASAIETQSEKLARAESIDTGKPLSLSQSLDIPRAIKNFRFFADWAPQHLEKSSADLKTLSYTTRTPVGVAGLISPWNLPLYLLTWKIAPALAVGNTVVCKPSELTPMTAFLLAGILDEIQLPAGVCNIVFGRGETAGATLCSHPAVHLISFTGGTDTGAKILHQTADSFKKVSLELGGKNPLIIFADADLKKTIPEVLRASFLNQGEICLCGERIFVQEKIYDEFLAEFKKQAEQLVVGDPMNPDTFMGPLISQAHLNKVHECVTRAQKDGGKILVGGEPINFAGSDSSAHHMAGGFFYSPTILVDLDRCSEINQEEIFGPVVSVLPFKYAHEVVQWANTSRYGLSASIWTRDLSRAHKIAQKLEVGTVWVNTWMKRDLRMPFGGFKASGLGREGGEASIDFFTEQKTITIDLG